MHDYVVVMDSPVGRLGIALQGDLLSRIDFLTGRTALLPADRPVARRVARQLERYFSGRMERLDVPLLLAGTAFQQRVWRALQDIPAGAVVTYGQLAARLDSGARAVGNACRHNPLPLVVPCHRVVAASGPGGYSGKTAGPELRRKCWLLQHEADACQA